MVFTCGCFLKIGVLPNHPLEWAFPIFFHHPFWGTPILPAGKPQVVHSNQRANVRKADEIRRGWLDQVANLDRPSRSAPVGPGKAVTRPWRLATSRHVAPLQRRFNNRWQLIQIESKRWVVVRKSLAKLLEISRVECWVYGRYIIP